MRVFVTGATGFIGSAVVRELLDGGHTVVGLARSDAGAAALQEVGAQVLRGDLEDLGSLRVGAAEADGVIHLAFVHNFNEFARALATDLRAVEAMGSALAGSGKPLVITAHLNGQASEQAARTLPGVRAAVVRLAPCVHGEGDRHGFISQLIAIARAQGVCAQVGDGSNRWPAVHRLDAARLYRLALEGAPAGARLTGWDEEGIPFRDIAAVISKRLNLEVTSISREEAEGHFGFLGAIVAADLPSLSPGSSAQTRTLLGWRPVHPGLLADLEQGHYFAG